MALLATDGEPYGQKRISFLVEDLLLSSSAWLQGYLESMMASGVKFQSGETIQIGWMSVLIGESPFEDVLELFEPDFDSMPICWIRGVNHTMRHLSIQRKVCELLDCEPQFPSIMNSGIVSPKFATSTTFRISREPEEKAHSGWFLMELDYGGPDGRQVSLYELSLTRRDVIPYLALPSGTEVKKTGSQIEIRFDGRRVSSEENDFLKALRDGGIFV